MTTTLSRVRVIAPAFLSRSLRFTSASTNQYIDCGSATELDDLTACTMLAWFQLTEAVHDTLPRIGEKASVPGGDGKNLQVHDGSIWGSTTMRWLVKRATTAAIARINNPLTVRVWYFVAGTYDAAASPAVRMYLGSQANHLVEASYDQQASGSGGTTSDATGALRWANRNDGPADGTGARVCLGTASYYNRALSLPVLQRLFKAQRPEDFVIRGCVSCVAFDKVGNLHDYSGWSNHGTPVGGPVVAPGPGLRIPRRRVWRVPGGTTFTQTLTSATTPAGAIIKQAQKPFAGTETPAGALVHQIGKLFASSTGPTGLVIKMVQKPLTSSTSPTGTLVRQVRKAFAATQASAGALVQQVRKQFTSATTPSGVLANTKVVLLALAGTVTSAGTLVKQAGKALASSTTPTGTLVKRVSHALAGTVTSAGVVLKRAAISLAGSIASSGVVVSVKTVLAALIPPFHATGTSGKTTASGTSGATKASGTSGKTTGSE